MNTRDDSRTLVKQGWSGERATCRACIAAAVVYGLADPLVRAAAADIPAHGIVNVRIGRIGFLRQQRRPRT